MELQILGGRAERAGCGDWSSVDHDMSCVEGPASSLHRFERRFTTYYGSLSR